MIKEREWIKAKHGAIEAIEGIKKLVKEYHFEGCTVAPYGVELTVREMLMGWDNFENKSYTAQLVILGEAMLFNDVLKCWIEHEHTYPKMW